MSAGKTLFQQAGSNWKSGSLEYTVSLNPLFVQLRPQVLHGVAFEPVIFRWNSNLHLGRVIPYIELAGGAVHTNENLPLGDTSSFNFTARGGGGIYLTFKRRNAWDAGIHWSHISNANLGARNPEFNGVEVRFGYHWFR